MKRLIRMWKARRYHVPFRVIEWYNYMAMLPKKEREEKNYIEIFNEQGCYIDCPEVGGMVKYRYEGNLYWYKVVGFKNESRNKDWLFRGDWINPIIEFISKVE